MAICTFLDNSAKTSHPILDSPAYSWSARHFTSIQPTSPDFAPLQPFFGVFLLIRRGIYIDCTSVNRLSPCPPKNTTLSKKIEFSPFKNCSRCKNSAEQRIRNRSGKCPFFEKLCSFFCRFYKKLKKNMVYATFYPLDTSVFPIRHMFTEPFLTLHNMGYGA